MIVTDIPTNALYKQPVTTFYYQGSALNNSKDKYFTTYDSQPSVMHDLCLAPNSAQNAKLRRGLVMASQAYNDAYYGLIQVNVMVHDAAATLADFQHNWKQVPGASIACGTGNFGFNTARGRVFAQRQGEFTYSLLHVDLDYGSATVGYKFNRDEFSQVWFSESFYLADFAPVFDVQNGQFFVSDDANPFIWHIRGGYRSLADGNDAQQGSFMFGIIDDGSPIGSYRFYGDNTGGNPYENSYGLYVGPGSGYHFTGKSASFQQKYSIPRGEWGYGPYFVQPWRTGSYNPAEMWFYLLEFDRRGFVTGRIKIYRSSWKQGTYKRYDNPRPDQPLGYWTAIYGRSGLTPDGNPVDPVYGGLMAVDPTTFNFHPDRPRSFEEIPTVIDDDPAYNAGPKSQGGARYPKLNQHGFAYEHDWFNKAHYVGTVGPFANLQMRNPKNTPQAAAQNDSYGYHQGNYGLDQNAATISDFKVMRDRKRRGTLHMVLTTYDRRVFFASSGDDGRTWSRGQQGQGPKGYDDTALNANPQGYYDYARAGAAVNTSYPLIAERTFQDATLMAAEYYVSSDSEVVRRNHRSIDRYENGSRNAMFVVDYANSGVGKSRNNGVVFKNGELVRQAWL